MAAERALNTGASSNTSVVNVYVLSLFLSACSLLYELLIAQTLTTIAGNMVIWYSLTVGTYLAAMGIGSIFCGVSDTFRGWKPLFRIEIMLSLIGASAVILLELAHTTYIMLSPDVGITVTVSTITPIKVAFYAFSFILTFLIGILSGMELPLLIFLGNDLAKNRKVTNRVLGWDYMGALVGGVVFPLYMVPLFQLHTLGFLVAGLNLMVAVYILVRFLPHAPSVDAKILASTAFAALLIVGCSKGDVIEQFFLKKYYYYNTLAEGQGGIFDAMNDKPAIFRKNSPYQKIDLVHFPNYEDDLIDTYSTKYALNTSMPRSYVLFLNGDLQFTSDDEEVYHEWLAHVPIIINGKVPKRILLLGGGDGLLHRELLKYNEVESITHVDIDRNLVTLAKTHPILTAMNGHSFDEPRVHTIYGDAFQYLRNYTGESYDAIYMDFPTVIDYNLSKLYSREFFYLAKVHLKDDGFIALDTPESYYGIPLGSKGLLKRHRGDWLIHSNTMRLAGFKTVLPFYSILETDNAKAYARLVEQDVPKKLDYLKNYSEDTQEGFVMLRKNERYGRFEYIDFGIQLHVLNEKRFQLSYPESYKPIGRVDLSQVNSILRPTLPHGLMWYIRSVQ